MVSPRCGAVMLILGLALSHGAAHAQGRATPAHACASAVTDDTLRPIPASLVAAATRLFGLHAPASVVQGTTVFRCAHGRVLICNIGADLPCGRANTSRALPGAGQYCREHADASFIPMFVTGQDTIYRWRCDGADAVAGEPIEQLDPRGFIARYWKPLS
jgi:hypothetical protein